METNTTWKFLEAERYYKVDKLNESPFFIVAGYYPLESKGAPPMIAPLDSHGKKPCSSQALQAHFPNLKIPLVGVRSLVTSGWMDQDLHHNSNWIQFSVKEGDFPY